MEMRNALEAAFAEEEKNDESSSTTEIQSAAPAETSSAVQTNDEVTSDAERKTDSAKADSSAVETQKSDAAGKKAEVQTPAKVEPEKGSHRVDRAPASWTKEAKGEWANVPLHIRQEVHRRESEVNRVLQESAVAKQVADTLSATVQPYAARLQSMGLPPMQAINEFLKVDYALATGSKQQRAQVMANLIKSYDVDLESLDTVLAGVLQGNAQRPDLESQIEQRLMQRFAPMLQAHQATQRNQLMAQQQQQQQAVSEVEQMSMDPQYPHFDTLREEMADIIEINARRGVYITLPEAYNKAVQLSNPIQQQNNASQQHQAALKARNAASSVSASPAGGGSQQFEGDGSLRGSIEAAFANMRV